ncbi:MAG: hypothetical protein P8P83_02390 [Rickettsiaceae bacterium]|nr:hypothetical protein [Rickettsiaceae bacterium]
MISSTDGWANNDVLIFGVAVMGKASLSGLDRRCCMAYPRAEISYSKILGSNY